MNVVSLIGRICTDIEVRYTNTQKAVGKFRLAVNRQGKDKGADFINIVVWGNTAEVCEKYLAKGRQVGIEGRIETGSYERQDGTKVYTTDVVANRVEIIDWPEKGEHRGNQATPEQVVADSFAAISESVPF